ncbi:MAG: alpha/beta hydrolase, partial [Oricola sp.]
ARTSHGLRTKLAEATGQVMDDFVAISAERATFADYAAIPCPVLAITGRQSPEVTQHLTERLSRSLPSAKLAEIIDAGHMAPVTDPHLIDPMIAAHISATERTGQFANTAYPVAA